MNILVLFTGGTIGSSVENGYISPNEKNKSKLIEMYRENTKDAQEFDVDTPYTVLSENLDGSHITKLVHCLNKYIKLKKYDGIIVTHGTDTLQYMAATIGILFEKAEVPVIFVSSNYPLEDERANGLENFKAAVEYIKAGGQSGVYVSYKNNGANVKLFEACNILRYDIYSDEIRSITKQEKTAGIRNDACSEDEVKKSELNNGNIDLDKLDLGTDSPIKYIEPYPGIKYEIPDKDIKAILFGTYHSGTIQTASKELQKFCNEMKTRNIPMYICGVPEGIGYESTKYYDELGIKVLPYGTDIYWFMKLWISVC